MQFFALPGRPFCRKKVDRAEKVCDIVTTHADEMVCQFSAENGRSYMRIARALIFFWGKCDQTTSDSGKFRTRRPDVPANQGSPGGGRRPPPGRVPPRHARSLQICSKLFFLPSDTIRAKITPFAAFRSFVQPCLSGCQQRVALGASQNTEVSKAMYLHLMRDLLANSQISSQKCRENPRNDLENSVLCF